MKPIRHLVLILLATGMGTSGCSRREGLVGDGLVILDGATAFIDGALQPNVVIVLQENRITRVGSSGQFRYPPSTTVLDLHGRYILPGLIDMHVHVPPGARAETVRALLAHGVTTFRSPGLFDTTAGVQLRRLLATGHLVGPRMIAGGDFINGAAGIRSVVYAFPATELSVLAGPDFLVPCRELFERATESVVVIGPMLVDEPRTVHLGFWTTPVA